MIQLADFETKFTMHPVEKIISEGYENTPYGSWLKTYIEIKTKGLNLSTEWGCHIHYFSELYTSLNQLKETKQGGEALFSSDEGMVNIIFRKTESGLYSMNFTVYTHLRSDIYVSGILGLDTPSMDSLIIGVNSLIKY